MIEKDELMREIWTDSIVEENNLNQNISILRRIFGKKPGDQRFIVTVAGHGFRFVPEIRHLPSVADGSTNVTLSGDATTSSEAQIANHEGQELEDKNPARNRESRARNRVWVGAIGVLSVLALGAAGFYLWRGGSVEAPVRTVAVLSFKPLVVEGRNEALELGMADTLISKLSGGDEVIVRPLNAIRRYSSLEQDSLQAGRELGVESILEGRIQTWGDRIRISAKLLRTSDGKQLWAEQFDEKSTDIFVVQDSISEKVADALKIRLGSRLYLKGRYHFAKLTPAEMESAASYYKQAIAVDPTFALAWAELAGTYRVYGIAGLRPPREVFPNAKAAAQKAVELDDTLADAHLSLGQDNFWYDWDWSAAENRFRRALELDPNNAIARMNHAVLLSNRGRHTQALVEARRACELDRLALPALALEGLCLLHAGRTDEALDRLQKASELEPNFWMPHMFAASAYIEKGMYREAIASSGDACRRT